MGVTAANLFDPSNESWTQLSNMTYQRWYPSATTLSDGTTIVTSGEMNGDENESLDEFLEPA